MRKQILNAKGQPIVLNNMEAMVANALQHRLTSDPYYNALGVDIDITTLTTVMKQVSEQKFFQVKPADYLPIRVGEGAWSAQLLTYRSYSLAADFEAGIVNTGSPDGRMASANTGVDGVPVKVVNWGKTISWTLFDLQQASKAGSWDIVSSLEQNRKQNWDLGIQKIAFLGARADSSVKGLLTLSDVETNTDVIPRPISSLSPVDLKQFCTSVLNAYRSNCARSAWPTHFIMPESDFLGIAAPVSSDFPIKSIKVQLEETFQTMTGNPNFKILPLAYGDIAYNPGATQQTYVLLNYDEKSIRMDVPVDYQSTLANTLNGFSFENVGYGQFTGVVAYRPKEALYFKFTP